MNIWQFYTSRKVNSPDLASFLMPISGKCTGTSPEKGAGFQELLLRFIAEPDNHPRLPMIPTQVSEKAISIPTISPGIFDWRQVSQNRLPKLISIPEKKEGGEKFSAENMVRQWEAISRQLGIELRERSTKVDADSIQTSEPQGGNTEKKKIFRSMRPFEIGKGNSPVLLFGFPISHELTRKIQELVYYQKTGEVIRQGDLLDTGQGFSWMSHSENGEGDKNSIGIVWMTSDLLTHLCDPQSMFPGQMEVKEGTSSIDFPKIGVQLIPAHVLEWPVEVRGEPVEDPESRIDPDPDRPQQFSGINRPSPGALGPLFEATTRTIIVAVGEPREFEQVGKPNIRENGENSSVLPGNVFPEAKISQAMHHFFEPILHDLPILFSLRTADSGSVEIEPPAEPLQQRAGENITSSKNGKETRFPFAPVITQNGAMILTLPEDILVAAPESETRTLLWKSSSSSDTDSSVNGEESHTPKKRPESGMGWRILDVSNGKAVSLFSDSGSRPEPHFQVSGGQTGKFLDTQQSDLLPQKPPHFTENPSSSMVESSHSEKLGIESFGEQELIFLRPRNFKLLRAGSEKSMIPKGDWGDGMKILSALQPGDEGEEGPETVRQEVTTLTKRGITRAAVRPYFLIDVDEYDSQAQFSPPSQRKHQPSLSLRSMNLHSFDLEESTNLKKSETNPAFLKLSTDATAAPAKKGFPAWKAELLYTPNSINSVKNKITLKNDEKGNDLSFETHKKRVNDPLPSQNRTGTHHIPKSYNDGSDFQGKDYSQADRESPGRGGHDSGKMLPGTQQPHHLTHSRRWQPIRVPGSTNLSGATQSIWHEEIADQIVHSTRMILSASKRQIQVQLKPEYLGFVKIVVKENENEVKGILFVERPEVRRALETHLPMLHKAFQEQQIRMDRIEVVDFSTQFTDQQHSRDLFQNERKLVHTQGHQRSDLHNPVLFSDRDREPIFSRDFGYNTLELII